MGEAVRAAFAEQHHWCSLYGSPFTARLVKLLGERLDRSSAVGRRILDWPGDASPGADNLPARATAALHYLARSGDAPALAALYPPAPLPEEETLWGEVAPLLASEAATFDSFLDNPPQTNEVGRAAPLMAGLLVLADRFALPMRLFELGASGGLNLLLDRYGYNLGGLRTGNLASRLQLAPAWRGAPPPDAEVRIVSRAGVDLSPRDLSRDGERLLAFVWADQQDRIARLEAALQIAAGDPPQVDRGEAAEWLEEVLLVAPRQGAARVVYHSIAFQYFPPGAQRRIAELMESLGAEADATAPLAWLRFEQAPGEAEATLRLRTWPGEDRLLARAHAHGAHVEWLG